MSALPAVHPHSGRTLVARRALTVAAVLLVAAGSVLSGRAVYMRAKAELAAHLIAKAWKQTIATGQVTRPWSWADTYPIGRLKVMRLGYDEVILEGASGRNMAFGPARMTGTANLGEAGNTVVAGHRTSWFQELEHVRIDDEIVIEYRDDTGELQRRSYRVVELKVIEPDDLSYIAPSTKEYLTLMTCFPFGNGPVSTHRYVVRAVPVPRGGDEGNNV